MRRWWLAMAMVALPLLAAWPAHASEQPSEAPPGAASHEASGGHGAHEKGWFEENGGLVKVIAVQVLAFVLLLAALKKWVIPVIGRMLNERAENIRETYAKLEHEKAELERLTKLAQEKLAGIERETAAKIDAAVKEGGAQREAILSEATSAAERILAKAKSEIEVERAKAVEEIRQEMVRLSLEAAERLVKQQLTPAKQEELVERFISELEKVKA